jgi:hypothetical protein
MPLKPTAILANMKHKYTYFLLVSNEAARPRLEEVLRSLLLDLSNEPGALFRKGEASI